MKLARYNVGNCQSCTLYYLVFTYYLSFRIIYLLYIWHYRMQEARMLQIRYIVCRVYTTQIIPFNFTENRLGVPWRREAPLSLSCWLCKKPLSLRLPQYLDLCAFYVHNLKSAKAGRASEGGRKCAQISGCFPEDSLTYGLRFLEFGRTPIFGNGQDWMIPVPGRDK